MKLKIFLQSTFSFDSIRTNILYRYNLESRIHSMYCYSVLLKTIYRHKNSPYYSKYTLIKISSHFLFINQKCKSMPRCSFVSMYSAFTFFCNDENVISSRLFQWLLYIFFYLLNVICGYLISKSVTLFYEKFPIYFPMLYELKHNIDLL